MTLSCWVAVMGPVHTSRMNNSYIKTKNYKGHVYLFAAAL